MLRSLLMFPSHNAASVAKKIGVDAGIGSTLMQQSKRTE